MNNDEEIWKDIKGCNGDYQISTFGNVKSLKNNKEKILSLILMDRYYKVNLSVNNKRISKTIHVLMGETFLNYKFSNFTVIDHKDNNQLNNKLENLQIITTRKNSSKDRKGSSEYTGVSWKKGIKKWVAQIYIKPKYKHLGYFNDEKEASDAYKLALHNINK